MRDMNQQPSWKVPEAFMWDAVKNHRPCLCLWAFVCHRALVFRGGGNPCLLSLELHVFSRVSHPWNVSWYCTGIPRAPRSWRTDQLFNDTVSGDYINL